MEPFSSEFYATAAQITAILFVLVAVEFRWLIPEHETEDDASDDDREWEPPEIEGSLFWPLALPAVAVGLVATAALGIGSALYALSQQQSSTVYEVLVVGGLAAHGLLVLLLPLSRNLGPLADSTLRRQDETLKKIDSRLTDLDAELQRLQDVSGRRDEFEVIFNERGRLRRQMRWSTWLLRLNVLPHIGFTATLAPLVVAVVMPLYALVALVLWLL